MIKTPFYSYRKGSLAKGCRMCVKGEKLVLFITGLCSCRCFYCPISDQKKDKDVRYANEMPVTNIHKIIKEAKLCSAKGAGITGGDPLLKLWDTCFSIRRLKKEFGKKFHIHLYTPLDKVSKKVLQKLYHAGLDEIRFHPVVWKKRLWKNIEIAGRFGWDIGVEIPALPGYEKETKALLDFLDGKIKFLNLNELEISDTNAQKLLKKNYVPKDSASYGVLGSEKLALMLLGYCKDKSYSVHYCTTTLKDKVQMAKRIIRRAKNVSLSTDTVTKEGMLKRGVIYLPEFQPSFSYHKKLNNMKKTEKNKIILKLKKYKKIINNNLRLKKDEVAIDGDKLRLLTSQKLVRKNKDKIKGLGLVPALIEEYPTYDGLEIELDIL